MAQEEIIRRFETQKVRVIWDDEQKQNYLRNVYETAYLRDVIDRNHLQNKEGLREKENYFVRI